MPETPSPTRRTQLLILVWVGGGFVYEGWALLNKIPGDSVSAAMWAWGDKHPDFRTGCLLAIVALVLHFFAGWRRSKTPE